MTEKFWLVLTKNNPSGNIQRSNCCYCAVVLEFSFKRILDLQLYLTRETVFPDWNKARNNANGRFPDVYFATFEIVLQIVLVFFMDLEQVFACGEGYNYTRILFM